MIIVKLFVLYLILINLTGFAVMGIDKRRAIQKRWRVRESTLFLIALAGGSAGSIVGMRTFHHKTRHWYFVYGMPLILLVQIGIMTVILKHM
ncbi:MAG: DUF1294 domain-containing protein [Lachnospiraceae bacterium]|nr:DUF1294 domain-containing protein [Lachnospiraceae bacterium]